MLGGLDLISPVLLHKHPVTEGPGAFSCHNESHPDAPCSSGPVKIKQNGKKGKMQPDLRKTAPPDQTCLLKKKANSLPLVFTAVCNFFLHTQALGTSLTMI